MPLSVVSGVVRLILAVTAGLVLPDNPGSLATRWLGCGRTLSICGIVILTVIGMRRRYGRAAGVRSRRDWPFLIDLANQVASLIRCGQDCPFSVKVSDPD